MKVLVPLLDGFEEIEAMTIIDVLRRAEINVTTAGPKTRRATGAHGVVVEVDTDIEAASKKPFDWTVLPGGMPGAENLKKNESVLHVLRETAEKGQGVAAICAAPIAIAAAGLHHGKKATCYPGFESHLEGATVVTDRVVQDGKLITSRGPGTALEFALKLVQEMAGEQKANALRTGMLVS